MPQPSGIKNSIYSAISVIIGFFLAAIRTKWIIRVKRPATVCTGHASRPRKAGISAADPFHCRKINCTVFFQNINLLIRRPVGSAAAPQPNIISVVPSKCWNKKNMQIRKAVNQFGLRISPTIWTYHAIKNIRLSFFLPCSKNQKHYSSPFCNILFFQYNPICIQKKGSSVPYI